MHNRKLVAAAAVAACASASSAAIQYWEMGGSVGNLQETPGYTGGATTWSATITIDTNAADTEPASNVGYYPISVDMTVGTVNVVFDAEFGVVNDATDQVGWGNFSGPVSAGPFNSISMAIDMSGSNSIFSSDAIPQPLPDLSTFGAGSIQILLLAFETNGTGFQFAGTVDYINVIPAPGTVGLLGLGLLGRRRR